MACCDANGDLKSDPNVVDACFRPIPNYVGKVAYIMGGGDSASYGGGGLFVIVAQDGDRRIDAVPLMIGYQGQEIKRFNLFDKQETFDGKTKKLPAAVVSQVRDDEEFVLDWCRRQYRWGSRRTPNQDGKRQWCEGVYDNAMSTAELVFVCIERIILDRRKAINEIREHYMKQFQKAAKNFQLRQAYCG
jgi:hypothetical protein